MRNALEVEDKVGAAASKVVVGTHGAHDQALEIWEAGWDGRHIAVIGRRDAVGAILRARSNLAKLRQPSLRDAERLHVRH